MINPKATDPLTLQERAELELRYDGPIAEQVIADKIAMRGTEVSRALDAVQLTAHIRFCENDRRFYQDLIDADEREIAQLMADREGLYSVGEWDRKTRHINSMIRSRESKQQTVDFYNQQIARAKAQLVELTATPLAAE
jgi:hypothetical protein